MAPTGEEIVTTCKCGETVVAVHKNVTTAGTPHLCNSIVVSSHRKLKAKKELKLKDNPFFKRKLERNKSDFEKRSKRSRWD